MKINKTYQTYPFALTVGSLLNAMDSKWNRDQNSKDFNLIGQERLSDFSVSECDESYESISFCRDSQRMRFRLPRRILKLRWRLRSKIPSMLLHSAEKIIFGVLEIPESCDNGKVSAKTRKWHFKSRFAQAQGAQAD